MSNRQGTLLESASPQNTHGNLNTISCQCFSVEKSSRPLTLDFIQTSNNKLNNKDARVEGWTLVSRSEGNICYNTQLVWHQSVSSKKHKHVGSSTGLDGENLDSPPICCLDHVSNRSEEKLLLLCRLYLWARSLLIVNLGSYCMEDPLLQMLWMGTKFPKYIDDSGGHNPWIVL